VAATTVSGFGGDDILEALRNHGIQFGIALELAAGNVFAVLVDI
jgi:hypothetical protein